MSPDVAFYGNLLNDIKTRIRQAQYRAATAVNIELVHLYWDIGRMLHQRQQQEGWGAGVVPRLAHDLHNELPELKGFSERNIKRMVQFAREYPDLFLIGPPLVAQLTTDTKDIGKGPLPVAQLSAKTKESPPFARIPWAHNILQLLGKPMSG